MNKRTARLLRRSSPGSRKLYKRLKREWNSLPKKERRRHRIELRDFLRGEDVRRVQEFVKGRKLAGR